MSNNQYLQILVTNHTATRRKGSWNYIHEYVLLVGDQNGPIAYATSTVYVEGLDNELFEKIELPVAGYSDDGLDIEGDAYDPPRKRIRRYKLPPKAVVRCHTNTERRVRTIFGEVVNIPSSWEEAIERLRSASQRVNSAPMAKMGRIGAGEILRTT